MTRKYYEDLTFYQKRVTVSQKRKFRDYVQKQARDVGLKTSVFPEKNSRKNVIVGDLRTAKYVLCAHYDTTLKLPMMIQRNYAFCHRAIEIISLILGIGLGVLFYFLGYLWIGIACLVLFLYSFIRVSGLIPVSRRFNYNNNTSGVIALLGLMEDYKDFNQKVAYIFLDNKEKNLGGSAAISKFMQDRKWIVQKDDKKFIFFDCIGIGKDITISWYRETKFVGELKQIFEDMSNDIYSVSLKEDSKYDVNDYLSFKKFDHASITVYKDVKKNKYSLKEIKPKRDNKIDLKTIDFICKVISEYIIKGASNGKR